MASAEENRRPGAAYWQLMALILCLIPWAILQYRKFMNWDNYWMIICASRLLRGQTSTQGFYHVEFPLATLVYIPPYLLSEYIGISLSTAVILMTGFLIVLSGVSVFLLAKCIVTGADAFLLSLLLVLAETVPVLNEFGQRDQILALALVPFVLAQVLLTKRIECSRLLLWPVLAVGAVLILLKPHHGLLPALILVCRAITQRRWSVVRDPDFLALAAAVTGYAGIIWFFFHDWATQVLPDIVLLYPTAYSSVAVVIDNAMIMAVLCGLVFLLYQMAADSSVQRRLLMKVLLFAALVCVVPYVVQLKDFKYHLMPALAFFWLGAGMTIYIASMKILPRNAAALAALLIIAGSGYASNSRMGLTPAMHMESMPLTRLAQTCSPGCSFLLLSVGMSASLEASYYSGAEIASRFPDMWFLPVLVKQKTDMDENKKTILSRAQYIKLSKKYAALMREDIDQRKPTLIINCPQDFDYFSFLSLDPGFPKAWSHYRKYGTVPIDYAAYYPDNPQHVEPPFSCDVYRRIAAEDKHAVP